MRKQLPVQQLQNYLLASGQDLPLYGADGYYGAETTKAISDLDAPNHVKIALKEIGIYEIKGPGHHPRILEYMKATTGKYSDDETPWCGAFIAWVCRKANIGVPFAYPERAKAWLAFGTEIGQPVMGAIAVKSRKGGGHVNIVVGMTPQGKLWCVGGNQNDQVNLGLYDEDVFEEFRVPHGYDLSYDLPVWDGHSEGDVKES